jgi:O-glycosyl hydrolase
LDAGGIVLDGDRQFKGNAPATLMRWVTSASDDLAPKLAVTVTGGGFTATLASMTVTTFVGQ